MKLAGLLLNKRSREIPSRLIRNLTPAIIGVSRESIDGEPGFGLAIISTFHRQLSAWNSKSITRWNLTQGDS
jgi:hypothetical protein